MYILSSLIYEKFKKILSDRKKDATRYRRKRAKTPGIIYVGHLTSIAFLTLWNLTKNPGARVETFAFFAWNNRASRIISVCSAAIKALKNGCFNGSKHLFLYLYRSTTFHYPFSILIEGTCYLVGIVWIVDDMDSLYVWESSLGSLLNIFYSLIRWGIFDQI